MTLLTDTIAAVDRTGLPPFENLQGEREQVLWVLALGDRNEITRRLTATEVSDILRDVFGHSVSRQRVAAILGNERKTIHHAKRGDKWAYRIMQPGLADLQALPLSIVYIRPEEALSGIRSVQEIFGAGSGKTAICDPYVDASTVDLLSDFTKATELRLLTTNVKNAQAFKRDIGLLSKQMGIPVEVRLAHAGVLHDRYVIHEDGMLLCGTSLNGLGKKQSYVVSLPDDIRHASLSAFDDYWSKASPL